MTKEEFFATQALLLGHPRDMDARTLAPPSKSYAVGEKHSGPRFPDWEFIGHLMNFADAAANAGIMDNRFDVAQAHSILRDHKVMSLYEEFRQWHFEQERLVT